RWRVAGALLSVDPPGIDDHGEPFERNVRAGVVEADPGGVVRICRCCPELGIGHLVGRPESPTAHRSDQRYLGAPDGSPIEIGSSDYCAAPLGAGPDPLLAWCSK